MFVRLHGDELLEYVRSGHVLVRQVERNALHQRRALPDKWGGVKLGSDEKERRWSVAVELSLCHGQYCSISRLNYNEEYKAPNYTFLHYGMANCR